LCAFLFIGYYNLVPEKPGTSSINSSISAALEKPGNSSIENKSKPFIIIKADDFLSSSDMTQDLRWRRFFEYIEEKNIKASVGIIGDVLERDLDSIKANNLIDDYLKNASKRDTFEFWNHGYNHECDSNIAEFFNTSYEYQKEHLLRTQDLVKEKLNLTMHAFGAPCSRMDNNTLRALEDANITILFFGEGLSSDKLLILPLTSCRIDKNGVHIPNYKSFVDDYYSFNCSKTDYLLLQMHPGEWDDDSFEQFKKIIDFLIEQNATFIKPYEYYELMQK
jgi:peptidoglycan/xylan/chitin deacetylase (PgdA/CDA1 family)